jgi:hypothetical protein
MNKTRSSAINACIVGFWSGTLWCIVPLYLTQMNLRSKFPTKWSLYLKHVFLKENLPFNSRDLLNYKCDLESNAKIQLDIWTLFSETVHEHDIRGFGTIINNIINIKLSAEICSGGKKRASSCLRRQWLALKNAVFWDVTSCGSCKNSRFWRTYCLHDQSDKNRRAGNNIVFPRNVIQLLVTANVVPRSPILVTLLMEVIHSSETSNVPRGTRRNIPEEDILHSQRRKILKCYTVASFVYWAQTE